MRAETRIAAPAPDPNCDWSLLRCLDKAGAAMAQTLASDQKAGALHGDVPPPAFHDHGTMLWRCIIMAEIGHRVVTGGIPGGRHSRSGERRPTGA